MPRNMSAEEYQELGRRYYKLKQYEDAVEAFTKGLEIAPSPSLYDQRAASFDRLKNYTAAVKDGREMIKMNKKDVKGYLRTASVLEKMEKLDTALGIYNYGMKNVPVADTNFKILQQMHDKMNRKLSPARSVDLMTILPVELAEMILEYLTFRQVVNCMRVSRGWRDYLSKLPRLWLHLDMSGARKPIPRIFIDKAIRRSGNRVNRLTVHRFEHMDILKNIAKTCKELTQLEFITLPHAMATSLIDIVGYAKNLKKLTVHPEITEDTASQLLHHRLSLEHAVFGAVKRSRSGGVDWTGQYSQLQTLALPLVNDVELDRHMFSRALFTHHAPKLRSLTLANVVIAHDTLADLPLEILILRQVRTTLGKLPQFPKSVRTLVCEGYNLKGEITPRVLPQLAHLSLVKADELSVRTMDLFLDVGMDDDGNYIALTNGQPLQSLVVCGSLSDPSMGLFRDSNSMFGRSSRILTPALKTLDIQTLPCDDSEIEHLLGYDLDLTSINLSCTLISGASLKMLADKLPSLKSITANSCPKINGRDAIEYVQRKGIAISCSMREPKGSRRVRY